MLRFFILESRDDDVSHLRVVAYKTPEQDDEV